MNSFIMAPPMFKKPNEQPPPTDPMTAIIAIEIISTLEPVEFAVLTSKELLGLWLIYSSVSGSIEDLGMISTVKGVVFSISVINW